MKSNPASTWTASASCTSKRKVGALRRARSIIAGSDRCPLPARVAAPSGGCRSRNPARGSSSPAARSRRAPFQGTRGRPLRPYQRSRAVASDRSGPDLGLEDLIVGPFARLGRLWPTFWGVHTEVTRLTQEMCGARILPQTCLGMGPRHGLEDEGNQPVGVRRVGLVLWVGGAEDPLLEEGADDLGAEKTRRAGCAS